MKPVIAFFRICRLPMLFGGLLTVAAAAQAPVDLRMALVIGNSQYPGNSLVNPANDAKAMGASLRSLGFSVVELRDAPKHQMEAAVSSMRDALKDKNGIGMLYYAGHGLQMDWRNYMVPVDAKPTKASEVAAQSVDVGAVIDAFKFAGNRMNIVVLDACRDNPFTDAVVNKGLAPMDAPAGTFLAYATAPGNVADDGDATGGNGLYTRYLLQELTKPVARIEDVFKRVRLSVRQQSKGRQIPWESTSLEEDFYFNDGRIVQPAKPSEAELVRAFSVEKQDWARISDSKNVTDFFDYLQKYPKGFLSEQAQFKLDQLQKAQLTVSADKHGVKQLPSGSRRFQLGDEMVWEITDGFTKERRRYTQKVTYADDDRVEMNGGDVLTDQMGGVKKNRSGMKMDPALSLAPADIALGKTWRMAGTSEWPDGRRGENFSDLKVVALEEIAALGRMVKSYKVRQTGYIQYPRYVVFVDMTYWIDPSAMRVIRNDRMVRSGGKIVEYDSAVMVDANSAAQQ
ncbi:caspase family protein [Rhodoferax sp. AJA081-3]|uniref:caspase family protein n=1 Tax=Rhodoferax sp. AJA081-3 TaxID=2752316 RepID=UPI001ADFC4F8|nr:caspase family protein [Rhodoferax sp. AJA081-3]QTN27996.1 caspase family protein [Rhodoferax sp. AJA081-3]